MAPSESAMRRSETALDHGYSAAVAGVIADAMLAHQRGRRVRLQLETLYFLFQIVLKTIHYFYPQ